MVRARRTGSALLPRFAEELAVLAGRARRAEPGVGQSRITPHFRRAQRSGTQRARCAGTSPIASDSGRAHRRQELPCPARAAEVRARDRRPAKVLVRVLPEGQFVHEVAPRPTLYSTGTPALGKNAPCGIAQEAHNDIPAAPVYSPSGQSVQAELPVVALDFPAVHKVQVPPLGPEFPTLHTQLAAAVLEAGEFDLAGHGVHGLAVPLTAYVPASQGVHVDAPAALDVPAAQGVHVAAPAALEVPAPQEHMNSAHQNHWCSCQASIWGKWKKYPLQWVILSLRNHTFPLHRENKNLLHSRLHGDTCQEDNPRKRCNGILPLCTLLLDMESNNTQNLNNRCHTK